MLHKASICVRRRNIHESRAALHKDCAYCRIGEDDEIFFLIIGLGRFGRHMAKTLVEQKNEVLAIDIDEHRVNDSMQYVSNVQIGNATNERFVSSLGWGILMCAWLPSGIIFRHPWRRPLC